MRDSFCAAFQVVSRIEDTDAPEYRWMFEFAGRMKEQVLGEETLDDYLKAFAQHVRENLKPSGEFLDWSDMDALRLEYATADQRRRFASMANHFEKAVELSKTGPVTLRSLPNGWVVRVVNLASCLQTLQPGLPFLIPVNEETAKKLGTSLRTLSQAVNKAIELGYVTVDEDATQKGTRRLARRLRFNPDHPDICDSPGLRRGA